MVAAPLKRLYYGQTSFPPDRFRDRMVAGFPVGMLVLAAWEFIAGLGCFIFSSGILHRCDMPSVAKLKT